jgi:transcriptional regulator of heat shock response
MITERQEKLLKIILKYYIKTAQPVGSEVLADNAGFKISPATIRSEMANLTEKGYLAQPHTSAGRIPTEKAYQHYLNKFLKAAEPAENEKNSFKKIKSDHRSTEPLMKKMAQQLARSSGELVVMATDKNNFYYTGLSFLFSQPEFNQTETIFNISEMIDHLDLVMFELFDKVSNDTQILLGQKNPFSHYCGTILTRLEIPEQKEEVIFGLFGPVRMDYDQNLGLINYVKKILNN